MKILKSTICAMAVLLLSANFAFSQNFNDTRTVSAETEAGIDISIVDANQRRSNTIITPLSPMDSPVTVEILGRRGQVIFSQTTNETSMRIIGNLIGNAYVLDVYQEEELILTTPYLGF